MPDGAAFKRKVEIFLIKILPSSSSDSEEKLAENRDLEVDMKLVSLSLLSLSL